MFRNTPPRFVNSNSNTNNPIQRANTPISLLVGDAFSVSIENTVDIADDDILYGDVLTVEALNISYSSNSGLNTNNANAFQWITPTTTTSTARNTVWMFTGFPPSEIAGLACTFTVLVIDTEGASSALHFSISVAGGNTTANVRSALSFSPAALLTSSSSSSSSSSDGVSTPVLQGTYFSYILPENVFQVAPGAEAPIAEYTAKIEPCNSRRLMQPMHERRLLHHRSLSSSSLSHVPCGWITIGKTVDPIPRPLLYGIPGLLDAGVTCIVTVTATNTAGYSVQGSFPIHSKKANGECVLLLRVLEAVCMCVFVLYFASHC